MLHILTDGAADVPLAWQQQFDIRVVPVNIQFGEKSYIQDVELDREGFYRLVDEGHRIPKTAQPTPHQFAEFFRKIAAPGDVILAITVTSKLSGTFDSALAAAREVSDQIAVTVFDSRSGSVGIALLCREARLLDRAGRTLQEIVARLEQMRPKIGIVLTLDTLEYARLSGRVGALQAALASVLSVKPIAVVADGVVNITEKVRTRRVAIDRVVEIVRGMAGDQRVNMAIVHARDPQTAATLAQRARENFRIEEMIVAELSISLAINLGPGTVGIIFCPVE